MRRTARAALKHIGTPESRKALAQGSIDSNEQNRRTSDAPKTTASGITIKTLKEKPKTASSGMLNKHLDEATPTTQPLSSRGDVEGDGKQKSVDPTIPISADLLDKLAALDEDDEE